MGNRIPDPRRVKIHRNYTIDEAAELLQVHPNTVRNWIKGGLPLIDDQRPYLILGKDLAEHIRAKRASAKRPCGPGQMYCFRCRSPRNALNQSAELKLHTETRGELIAACAVCGTSMHRQCNPQRLQCVIGELRVSIEPDSLRIYETAGPFPNCDLTPGVSNCENAQS